MTHFDMLIRGGTIVDGSGSARFQGDVGITDGVITAIGPSVDGAADEVMDATGLIVAPGVLDLHTHYDAQVHWDPYCTGQSWNGVTSVVIGNCGFGYAPAHPESREQLMLMMGTAEQVPVSAQREIFKHWDWETFPEWMDHLRSIPKGINLLSYLPVNALLIYVMGEDSRHRAATAEEMRVMKQLLNEAMDAGAVGMSFSHLSDMNAAKEGDGSPFPADIHPAEDLYELAGVLRDRGQGFIEAFTNAPGVDFREVAEGVARASGRPVIHNLAGPWPSAPDHHGDILAWMTRCAEEGLQIYSQPMEPYWLEFSLEYFNSWERLPFFVEFVHASVEEKIRFASDPQFIEDAKRAYNPLILGGAGGPWETYVLITAHGATEYEKYEGTSLGEITEAEGRHMLDVLFDILAKSRMQAEWKSFPAISDAATYAEVIRHPHMLVGGSDGGAHLTFMGGSWSTQFISWLVRDEGLLTLEELHHRMSGYQAEVIGLDRRGLLRQGYAADLMVYDYDTIGGPDKTLVIRDVPGDGGAFRRATPAEGIRWVIVNGKVIHENGKSTGVTPGRMLSVLGPETDARLREVV
jgi:N-acyl-D-amino-acid deacylase